MRTQSTNQRDHAVVLGGSMAGLLAARVLSDHFERVTVVDRDEFPTSPAHRKGVPQSRHAHALLPRGAQIVGELFPGIFEALVADGAFVGDAGSTLRLVTPAGPLPTAPNGEVFVGASRFLLEWHVRQRLAARPDVTLVERHEATGLDTEGGDVVGVSLSARPGAPGATMTTLAADLVVDATGRGSKAPAWLHDLGYGPVPEERVESATGYATRWFARSPDWDQSWQAAVVNGRVPDNPRVGIMMPVEDGVWTISVGGLAGNFPPLHEQGFLDHARRLADPGIAKAIATSQPLTPIQGARMPTSRLRHFERLRRWPAGFIVTGDAVCAFNPIYGQGMTVSAMDAVALDRELRSSRPDFERRYRRAIAKTVANVWMIASGEDLQWGVASTGVPARRGARLTRRYVERLLRRAVADPVVAGAWGEVIGLLRSPAALFRPAIAVRVLAGTRGGVVAAPEPAAAG